MHLSILTPWIELVATVTTGVLGLVVLLTELQLIAPHLYQLLIGACTPKPRKLTKASSNMTAGMVNVV